MSKVFLSYRRADSLTITGRIHDRLVAAFGEKNIFKDVDDIEPGVDFRQVILDAIDESDVQLVIIGKQWLDLRNAQGQRRIDEPNDFVRMEVQTGLEKANLRVIPVLVGGAIMPDAQDLPDVLKELAFKNAMVVREDPDFNDDTTLLTNTIQRIIRANRKTNPLQWIAVLIAVLLLVGGVGGFLLLQNRSSDGATETPTVTSTATPEASETEVITVEEEVAASNTPTETEVSPTNTEIPTTNTPTETEISPTNTEAPATNTPTETEVPPTATSTATTEATETVDETTSAEEICEITPLQGNTAIARSGPSTIYRLVVRISFGERVEVIGRQQANSDGFFWWQTSEDTWVSNVNVRSVGACDDLPIVRFEN